MIRTLLGGGIPVTALHSHLLEETPRLLFMHFWANDDAKKLAMTTSQRARPHPDKEVRRRCSG